MCSSNRQLSQWLLIVLVNFCGISWATAGESAQSMTVRLNWFTNVEDAGILIQKVFGKYSEAGIDLSIIPYDKKTNACEAVATRKAHIGIEDTVLFAKCRKQFPQLIAFAAKYQINPVAILVLDPAMRTVQDLRGRIASTAYGYEVYPEIFREMMGYSKDELFIQYHGWEGEGKAALISGKIDAIFGFEPNDGIALRLAGHHPRVFRSYEFNYDFYGQVYIADRDYLRTNMKSIVKFLKITERGWHKAFANPQQTANTVIKHYYPFDPKQSPVQSVEEHRIYQTKELMLFKPYMERSVGKRMLYMVDAVWKRNIQTLQRMGHIDVSESADAYYTLDAIRQVYAR